MKSRLIRVSNDFALELEGLKSYCPKMTMPKLTRSLIPVVRKLKNKKINNQVNIELPKYSRMFMILSGNAMLIWTAILVVL